MLREPAAYLRRRAGAADIAEVAERVYGCCETTVSHRFTLLKFEVIEELLLLLFGYFFGPEENLFVGFELAREEVLPVGHPLAPEFMVGVRKIVHFWQEVCPVSLSFYEAVLVALPDFGARIYR